MPLIRSTYHRFCRRPGRAAGVLAAALALTASVPAAHASDLVITGAGEGHGVGMSQEGALGYALHGASYRAILAHYYRGTQIGQTPSGVRVRVLVGGTV